MSCVLSCLWEVSNFSTWWLWAMTQPRSILGRGGLGIFKTFEVKNSIFLDLTRFPLEIEMILILTFFEIERFFESWSQFLSSSSSAYLIYFAHGCLEQPRHKNCFSCTNSQGKSCCFCSTWKSLAILLLKLVCFLIMCSFHPVRIFRSGSDLWTWRCTTPLPACWSSSLPWWPSRWQLTQTGSSEFFEEIKIWRTLRNKNWVVLRDE